MRHLSSIVLAVVLLSSGCAAAEPSAKVTYIANEGFLIEVGSHKILIDAVFDDRTITYAHVPDEETLGLIKGSKTPFDEIDLMLVTHSHRDHFSVAPTLEHLEGNPAGILFGPPQVVEVLRIVEPELED